MNHLKITKRKMADFNISFRKTMVNEGGYSNNPNDRGESTYRGISKKWYPSWQGFKVIDQLRHEPNFPRNLENNAELQLMVQQFYRLNFWNPLYLDKINSQQVADELFDIAVNMGQTVAAEIAQRSINLMNKNQKLFPNLKVDGRVGELSAKAINNVCMMKANHDTFLKCLNIFQGWKYISICEKDESQEEFFIGWMNRV